MTFSEPLPADYEDLQELSDLFDAAFKEDPNFKNFYPSTPREAQRARSLKSNQAEFKKPGRKYFKIVDLDTGKIAAWSKWYFPHTPNADQREEKIKEPWPAGANGDLLDSFVGQLFVGRNKYIKHEDMYFMNVLAVLPEYQRKGLGNKLLEPILKQADREGRRTYIEASKKGLGLYTKFGWKEIDEVLVDHRPYGGGQVEKMALMMREPQPIQ